MSSLPIHDQAVRAWCAEQVRKAFAPLWLKVAPPVNPLAVGTFCGCGTRLDKAGRACPMCGVTA